MRRKAYSIFLFLSLLALLYAAGDYVCGHMDENPFNPATCPLCAAFSSIEQGYTLGTSLLDFDKLSIELFIGYEDFFPLLYSHLTVISYRAPPASSTYL